SHIPLVSPVLNLPSTLCVVTLSFYFSLLPRPPRSTLFPYTTLFRSMPYTSNFTLLIHDVDKDGAVSIGPWSGTEKESELIAELRSEEHTSELQSRENLVCRLLLEKKKKKNIPNTTATTDLQIIASSA